MPFTTNTKNLVVYDSWFDNLFYEIPNTVSEFIVLIIQVIS